jgi:WD40 repeat protein
MLVVVTAADTTVRVWDLATGAPVAAPISCRYGTSVLGVARRKDRTVVACLSDDGRTTVWDLATGELAAGPLDDWAAGRPGFRWPGRNHLRRHRGHPYDADADGYDDIALQVWDLAEGSKIGKPLVGRGSGANVTRPPVLITRIGDGLAVVSGSGTDGRLRVWDLTTSTRVTKPLDGHRGPLTAVAETEHDGHPLAVTARRDGTLRVWDTVADVAVANPGRPRRHRLGHTAT